jgi:hypothetical protein
MSGNGNTNVGDTKTENTNVGDAGKVDVRMVTMSMTRANKILIRLREAPVKIAKKSRYSYIESSTNKNGMEIGLLTYDKEKTAQQLAEMRETYEASKLKRELLEKWRNRLFEMNIKYGLHSLLSEIDLLKKERTDINQILSEYHTEHYTPLSQAIVSMDAVKTSEKKYEFKWKVGAFDEAELKKRVSNINKQLAILDNRKDDLNIQNTFSIQLNEQERDLVDLDD